jgi:hypothetical protein
MITLMKEKEENKQSLFWTERERLRPGRTRREENAWFFILLREEL